MLPLASDNSGAVSVAKVKLIDTFWPSAVCKDVVTVDVVEPATAVADKDEVYHASVLLVPIGKAYR